MDSRDQLLEFFRERLQLRGDGEDLRDHDRLFSSGRLDSLDAMQTVLFLEEHFAVDFSRYEFSIDLIDSPAQVLELLRESNTSG